MQNRSCRFSSALLLLALGALVGAPAQAQPQTVPEALDQLLDAYRVYAGRGAIEILGASAAAYDAQGTKWTGASGFADVAQTLPMTEHTRLNGSSSAKQLVAITFLKLKSLGVTHQGRPLSLDDPLADYGCDNTVGGLANGQCGWGMPARNPHEADNPIRIRHLLGNVSGIPVHFDDAAGQPAVAAHLADHTFFGPAGAPDLPNPGGHQPPPPWPAQDITAAHMVETYDLVWGLDATLSTPNDMWREPGIDVAGGQAGFRYNNLNFTLVALVIEDITGLPYDEVVDLVLFDPLRLAYPQLSLDFSQKFVPDATFSPGFGDGTLCQYNNPADDPDQGWTLATNSAVCFDFDQPGCLCADNQGWVDKRGFDGAWALGAGYYVSSVNDMADFLWALHNGAVLPKGAWAPPEGEYWELYEWTCDSTLGHDCGPFYRYGMAFYSEAVRNEQGQIIGETYGHDGGGFLPRYNRVTFDFLSAFPYARVAGLFVLAGNRLTAETHHALYRYVADTSLLLVSNYGL